MTFRQSPFEQMEQLMNEMNQMMAQMYHETWRQASPALAEGSEDGSTNELANWQDSGAGLPMSVDADEDGYTVVADIPGFEPEELELLFDEDQRSLRVTGTHEESNESSSHSRRVSEYMTVPGDAPLLIKDSTATYHNGVLEVHLPTETRSKDDDRTHHIDIN